MQKRDIFNLPYLGFFLLLVGMAISSCRSDFNPNVESDPEAHLKPGLVHAIHSDKLRRIMNDLKGLADDRLPQEMDIPGAQTRHFEKISRTADAMARSAPRIKAILPELGLANDARRVFLEMADQLESNALELGRHAASGRWKETSQAVEAIKSTCDACHGLFRFPPKTPLPSP